MIDPAVLIMFGVVITAVAAFIKERKEVKHPLLLSMILLGALISTVGAFWSSEQEDNYRTKLGKKTKNYQTKLGEKTDKIIDLNERLTTKSEEIAELNREIMYTVTGGDSFPYVFLALPDMQNSPAIIIHNKGKYPLYDVTLVLTDPKKINKAKRKIGEEEVFIYKGLKDARIVKDLGNFFAGEAREIGQWPFPLMGSDYHSYNISIQTRIGVFHEKLRLKYIGGRWRHSATVFGPNKQKVFHYIDPLFPQGLLDDEKDSLEGGERIRVIESLPEDQSTKNDVPAQEAR